MELHHVWNEQGPVTKPYLYKNKEKNWMKTIYKKI